jgi:uncharacterized membrane protein YfcA
MINNVLPKKIDYLYLLLTIVFIGFTIGYYSYWKQKTINIYALIVYIIFTFLAALSLLKAIDSS